MVELKEVHNQLKVEVQGLQLLEMEEVECQVSLLLLDDEEAEQEVQVVEQVLEVDHNLMKVEQLELLGYHSLVMEVKLEDVEEVLVEQLELQGHHSLVMEVQWVLEVDHNQVKVKVSV